MCAQCIRHAQSVIGAPVQCDWHAQAHNDVHKHIGTGRVYRYSYACVPWAFGLKVIVIENHRATSSSISKPRENHYPLNVVAEQVNFGYYQSS